MISSPATPAFGPRVMGTLIACLLPVTAAAQEERPVFRATTNLVDLTIVALDKQGRPVRDLRKEELRVYDQGKPREISFYHYDGAEDLRRPAKPKAAGFYSNTTEYLPGPAQYRRSSSEFSTSVPRRSLSTDMPVGVDRSVA